MTELTRNTNTADKMMGIHNADSAVMFLSFRGESNGLALNASMPPCFVVREMSRAVPQGRVSTLQW